jgi:hypothetical protein
MMAREGESETFGKGEVDSSILSGGTMIFLIWFASLSRLPFRGTAWAS